MGIKEILQKLKGNQNEKKEDLRRRINDIRLQKLAEDRMKSSDERDLENRIEKRRQEFIKKKLDVMRKQESDRHWRGKNLMKQKNIFKGHNNVLTDNKKLFKSKSNKMKGGMFFK